MSLRICWLVISMTSKPQFGGEKVKLSDLCSKGKSSLRQKDLLNDGPYLVYGASGVIGTMSCYQNEEPYVAVVKDGAGVGRVMACKGKSSVLGTMQALLPSKNVDLNYLLHLVRSLKLGDDFSGSTIPHIYFRDYGEREVPAIAIKQQIMIAGVLDKIEMMLARLDMTLKKQDQLVKSRFVEMFGSIVDNPKCWQTLPLSIAAPVDYKAFPEEDRVWQLTLDAVESMSGSVFSKTYAEAAELKGSIGGFDSSQVLYSKLRPYLNKVVVPDSSGVCTTELLPLSPLENVVNKVYLATALRSSEFVTFASNHSSGAKMPRIDMKAFRSFELPIPPLELQQEFADFVAQVDKSGFAVRKQIKKLQLLYDSLAQEYFGD